MRSQAGPPAVAIGGPQGIGKSTAIRVVSQSRSDIEVIYFGELLPDDFRSFSPLDKDRLRVVVAARVATTLAQRERATLVDLHYLDVREAQPRIQRPAFLEHFDLLVFLTAPPEVLLTRRLADRDRDDRPLTLVEAARDVEAHRAYYDELVGGGVAATQIDCQPPPTEIAEELLRLVDATVAVGPRSRAGRNGQVTPPAGSQPPT